MVVCVASTCSVIVSNREVESLSVGCVRARGEIGELEGSAIEMERFWSRGGDSDMAGSYSDAWNGVEALCVPVQDTDAIELQMLPFGICC